MTLAHITDHADRAAARLAGKLAGKPRFEALVRALVAPFQDIEDALWQLFESDVNTATGAALDVYGRIVGEPRYSETDDDAYRRRVRARIAANRSNGTVEDLIRVVKLILVDDEVRVQIRQFFPASILVDLDDAAVDADVADIVAVFVAGRTRGAAAAGIGTRVVHSEYDPDETFRFAETAYAQGFVAGANTFITFETLPEGAFPPGGGLVEIRGDDGLGTEHTDVIQYASYELSAPGSYHRFRLLSGETVRYDYPHALGVFGYSGALLTLVEPTVQRGLDEAVTVSAGTFDVTVTAGATYTVTVPEGYYTHRQFGALVERQLWLQDDTFYAGASWDVGDLGWRFFIGRSAGTITIDNFSNTTMRGELGFTSASHGPGAAVVAPNILNTGNGGRFVRDAEAA